MKKWVESKHIYEQIISTNLFVDQKEHCKEVIRMGEY